MSRLGVVGAHARRALHEWKVLAALLGATALHAPRRSTWRPSVRWVLSRQVYFTGVQALPFVGGIALLCGASIVLQAEVWLRGAGQSAWIGPFLVAVLLRELAPFVVNVVVLLRSGSAVVSELGSMTAAGEVRVLDAQGVDPFLYLVVPRVVGLALAVACLTVLFLVVAFSSGYACSVAIGVQPAGPLAFLQSVLRAVGGDDLAVLASKAAVPALLTGAVCCREGLSVEPVHTEVTKAVARALARSGLALFLSSLLLSIASYA